MPSSAVYELLANRCVNEQHEDILYDKCHILPSNIHDIRHDISLLSSYKYVLNEEPKYTNYTRSFVGVLDYIWCTSEHLKPLAVVPVIKEEVITQFGVALPNAQVICENIYIYIY